MQKIEKFHHSVTENGNIQVRIITEYQDDQGNIVNAKSSIPMTPADINDTKDWDQKTQDIAAVLVKPATAIGFDLEKEEQVGGGIEEIVSYDRVINGNNTIEVREIHRIFDNGKEVAKRFHRSVIMPGDDPKNHDVISRKLAETFHKIVI